MLELTPKDACDGGVCRDLLTDLRYAHRNINAQGSDRWRAAKVKRASTVWGTSMH